VLETRDVRVVRFYRIPLSGDDHHGPDPNRCTSSAAYGFRSAFQLYFLVVLISDHRQPFANIPINPSWLAVKPLHGEILYTDPRLATDGSGIDKRSKPIHLTCNLVPVTYKDVLERVPGYHARPPRLPEDQDLPVHAPPSDGYDLVFHVGVSQLRLILTSI
jgi:hypothetical protein